MNIDPKIKKFLTHYVDLVDNYNFDQFYKEAEIFKDTYPSIISNLTEILFSLEVNPIDYMNYIPDFCFHHLDMESFKIPNNITKIGVHAFSVCTRLKAITLPSSIKEIHTCAFSHCYSLANIEIPDSVKMIGPYAFQTCSNLVTVKLPDGIDQIRVGTFKNCSSLRSITIPRSVTLIDGFAFSECDKLKEINYQGTMKEWEAIGKVGTWNYLSGMKVPKYTVYCTDGNIENEYEFHV